jgi:hypothetical protein
MPLPSEVDNKIRNRFEDLTDECEKLCKSMSQMNETLNARSTPGVIHLGVRHLMEETFFNIKTRIISLIEFIPIQSHYRAEIIAEIRSLDNTVRESQKLLGILRGLKNDYESGLFENLAELIETNVAADYLGQAEQLLTEGQPGKYDHVPAAVLTGAILEDALRRLCDRQSPPIPTSKPNGDPKTLDPLISDLAKANVFNKIKADQLRSWAKIRNAAAHGEFGDFDRKDVEQMLVGVRNFLADYL